MHVEPAPHRSINHMRSFLTAWFHVKRQNDNRVILADFDVSVSVTRPTTEISHCVEMSRASNAALAGLKRRPARLPRDDEAPGR